MLPRKFGAPFLSNQGRSGICNLRPMSVDNFRPRSPRQHYVWSEKALSIVRSTRMPKKDGALVVQQLQALTTYPEKACWRLAERFGFRRPKARRVWSQEDVARIIELSETTCIREIAKRFKTTTRTIYL